MRQVYSKFLQKCPCLLREPFSKIHHPLGLGLNLVVILLVDVYYKQFFMHYILFHQLLIAQLGLLQCFANIWIYLL